MEHHNYFGTAWAALGMTAYYLALVWINTLLSLFLSPLFLIPMTWLQDRVGMRRSGSRPAAAGNAAASTTTITTAPARPTVVAR